MRNLRRYRKRRVGSLRDLSEFRSDEENLRQAVEAAGLGVYMFDLESRKHVWSNQLKTIFGISPNASAPGSILDFVHPEDRDRFDAARNQSLDPTGDGTFEDEHRIVRTDGTQRWVHVKGRVSFFEKEGLRKPLRGIGLVMDITDRKRAEEALAKEESRYRAIFESANDIVITLELGGLIVSVNPALKEILGYDPNEWVGRKLPEFMLPEEMGTQARVLREKIDGAPSTLYDLRIRHKDGRIRVLGVNSRLIRDQAGNPLLVHSIARDITHRREAEARQLLLLRELQHRTKNLLAVIQSLASSTLRDSAGLPGFIGRLHALSHAQDFVAEGPAGGAPIRGLLEATLEAFGTRVNLEGPEVTVGSSFAQSLALVVHELATNAAKYGSLSNAAGRVQVEWRIAGSAKDVFQFAWLEERGPAVCQPTRRGFGSSLISSFGHAKLDYRPEGLQYHLEMPMMQVFKQAFDN